MDYFKKKHYTSPAILDHRKIIFETVISSSLPPSNERTQPHPDDSLVTPPKDQLVLPPRGGADSGNSSTTDKPAGTPPNPQAKFPIAEPSIPELPLLGDKELDSLDSKEDLLNQDQDPSSLFSHSSNVPIQLQKGSSQKNANLQAVTEQAKDYYNLPNTSTTWYIWGIEGLIMASASGLALWLHQREKSRNEPLD